MNDTKIKDKNYVAIQGWMVNKLKLKGNELLIYAIIYMFSQMECQKYTGSRQYLADWTCSTKQGVDKNLKSLLNKGYIDKKDVYNNNIKYVYYWTTKLTGVDNIVDEGGQHSLLNIKEYIKENNNKENNKLRLLKENEEKSELENMETYKEIVGYMNEVYQHPSFNKKIPFTFKSQNKATQSLINARLREGYDIEEFKDVIWHSYLKFVEEEFKSQNGDSSIKYFRPSTIFSSKHFEEYLNEYRAYKNS